MKPRGNTACLLEPPRGALDDVFEFGLHRVEVLRLQNIGQMQVPLLVEGLDLLSRETGHETRSDFRDLVADADRTGFDDLRVDSA